MAGDADDYGKTQVELLMKLLGASLLVVLLLGGVAAQAALGSEGTFTPGVAASLKGSPIGAHAFTFGKTGARKVQCSAASLSGALALGPTVSVTPLYQTCTSSPGVGRAFVSVTPCSYKITATDKFSSSTGEGSLTIEGCAGSSITVMADTTGGSLLCSYSIRNQGPLDEVDWTNLPSFVKDVELSFEVTGISVEVSFGTLAACGAAAGNSTLATLTGATTATAEAAGGAATSLVIS